MSHLWEHSRRETVRLAMSSLGVATAHYDGAHHVAIDGVAVWRGYEAGVMRVEWVEEWIGDGSAFGPTPETP